MSIELTEKIADIEHVETPPVEPIEEERFELLKMADEKELAEKLTLVENALKFIDKLREFVLARTKANDWSDQSGNPYFGEAGCNRFMAPFKMYEKEPTAWTVDDEGHKRETSDKSVFEGNIRFIFFKGIIGSALLGVEASFEGGSRLEDGFKAKDDILFYLQKAKANWRGRGFRKILGMENLTWEDLGRVGIKRDQVRKIERLTTAKAETAEAQRLWNYLLDLNDGDAKKAEDYLFNLTNSKEYVGKRRPSQLSAKQIAWIAPKVKAEWDKKVPANAKSSGQPSGNGGGKTEQHEVIFIKTVEDVRKHLTDVQFSEVLAEYRVNAILEVPADDRNKFIVDLMRKNKKQ